MEIKGLEDILKAHDEFVRKVADLTGSTASGGVAVVADEGRFKEVSVRLQEDLLARQREHLDALIAAKERALRQFDEEITRRQSLVAALEDERKAAKRSLPIGETATEPPPTVRRRRGGQTSSKQD